MRIRNRRLLYFGVAIAVTALGLAAWVARSRQADGTGSPELPAGDAEMQTRAMSGMDMGAPMDGSIRLTGREVLNFGITFGTAEVRPLTKTIRAVGMVEFDERRIAHVAPKFGGWVDDLHVDFTGQVVRRGQPLLDVYSPELVTAQEELLLAARMARAVAKSEVAGVVDGADELLASARRRLAYWDISEAQIDRLMETGEVRRTLTLHAPISGVVMEKAVAEGQAFRSGESLYTIGDHSSVWVNVEVFESDAPLIAEGTPAEVAFAGLPGRPLDGRVEYVYPTLEDRTRSMRARVSIDNPRGVLKPGMYATVTMDISLGEALTLPAPAVLHSGERAVAFVDMGDGRIMPHELTLGVSGREYVQVLDGIEPGQRVVTSAQFLLDSESNLAEVMKAMMAQMNMSDMEGMDMEGADEPAMEGMEPPSGDGSRSDPDSTGGP